MRTPKIKAIKEIRDFQNQDNSEKYQKLDNYDQGSNARQAGFWDADGNFYFELKRNKKTGIANRIKLDGRQYQANKIYYEDIDIRNL